MTVPFTPRELFYPRHLGAIAATLLELSEQVEALGSRLCADPALVANHAHEMQLFDLVSQMHKELAALLEADCPACAARNVQLDALRE
ncbi:MAG: hypothetical protein NTX28_06995, partial [Novosphingobium sp.]|nr:hypothetical protein [Novosphingobium sp.]